MKIHSPCSTVAKQSIQSLSVKVSVISWNRHFKQNEPHKKKKKKKKTFTGTHTIDSNDKSKIKIQPKAYPAHPFHLKLKNFSQPTMVMGPDFLTISSSVVTDNAMNSPTSVFWSTDRRKAVEVCETNAVIASKKYKNKNSLYSSPTE